MIEVWYTCNCGHEFDVQVEPIIAARTYGPPEDCSPEEGGDITPDVCEDCGAAIDAGKCQEAAGDIVAGEREDYEESKAEDRRLFPRDFPMPGGKD